MIRQLIIIAAALSATTAYAAMPIFAAKCGPDLNVDTNPRGQVYMNGKVAKITNRPDGQISASSEGAWVDITPRGAEAPHVTYTARDRSVGACEILSFAPPAGAAASSRRSSHSERAGQGKFDARGDIPCAEGSGKPMRQCAFEVARGPAGSATVKVYLPSGKTRFIFFENGKPLSADLSQADASMHFRGTKRGEVYHIEAGYERYEIVEAVVFGG